MDKYGRRFIAEAALEDLRSIKEGVRIHLIQFIERPRESTIDSVIH